LLFTGRSYAQLIHSKPASYPPWGAKNFGLPISSPWDDSLGIMRTFKDARWRENVDGQIEWKLSGHKPEPCDVHRPTAAGHMNGDDTIWVVPKHSRAELAGRSFELRRASGGRMVRQFGTFSVRENPAGLISIDAVIRVPQPGMLDITRHHLPQVATDRIVKHPKPEIADFLLEA